MFRESERNQFSILNLIKNLLQEVEDLNLKALEVSLKVVGEKSLLTAKAYYCLGRIYNIRKKYTVIIIYGNINPFFLITNI